MGKPLQRLKHGKSLCGKVFGSFVETFNALVDFMLGIKGDADFKNGEGHITYDRENNIIRCSGCVGRSGTDVTANERSGLVVNDGEIDLSGRNGDDSFGIHKLSVKSEKESKKEYLILSNSDVYIEIQQEEEIEEKIDEKIDEKLKDLERVESLNGETGALEITGGNKVNVSTDGKTITISLDESKEDQKPDPNTSCDDHAGSEPGGGVSPGAGRGGGVYGGGVSAENGEGMSGVGCDC